MGVNRERGESLIRNVLLFCVLERMFWGQLGRKYLGISKTYFISSIRLSRERERERDECATEREREKGKERRDYLNVDI